MEAFLASLEAFPPAQYLRGARWAYAAVNGIHIFGIALLVGAILPLDLRLLGFWQSVPRENLVKVLVPVAACGLAVAVLAGAFLFATRAREYAGVPFFQIKLVLVLTGALAAIMLHRAHGVLLRDASGAKLEAHAAVSIVCWTGALACGRLIAFAG